MIYKEIPENFNSQFEIAGCFCEHDGKILLLHRNDHGDASDVWCVPAGGLEAGETPSQAMCREIWEETGLSVSEELIRFLETVYVRQSELDFIYHIFHTAFNERPPVVLNEESKNFAWTSPQEALAMPLVEDEDHCIKLYYEV